MNIWKQSAQEFKRVHTITGVALLLALGVIADFFFSIQVTPTLKFGFGYLVTALLGMLYGPVTAGIAGGIGDIIEFIIKPSGVFFFGFTLNAILGGMLYGFCFYKYKVTIWRCIIAKTCANVFINILLNTYWMSILMGKGFFALIGPRIAKNLILLPAEIIILYIVTTQIARVLRRTTPSPRE